MSHDDNLRKAGLPTVRTLTARILRVWGNALPSDIESGATWYDEAGDLAASLTRYDLSLEQASSVVAALSPRTTWDRNVRGAIALVTDGAEAALDVVFLTANVEKAERAMVEGFEAFNPKTAPKTRNFARNIAGDRESVTVDVWACRVAGVDETLLTRKGVYAAVEAAYQSAARKVGVEPTTMQATTWIVQRGGRAK